MSQAATGASRARNLGKAASLENQRVLTFRLGRHRYAIDVSYVLSIADDLPKVQLGQGGAALLGYVYFRSVAVKVYDSARILARGDSVTLSTLTEQLGAAQATLREYGQELEQQLKGNQPLPLPRLGQLIQGWQQATGHIELNWQPLQQAVIELGEHVVKLDSLRQGQQLSALEFEWRLLKRTHLQFCQHLLNNLQDDVRQLDRPVLLYLSQDGLKPWFALRLEQIEGITEYHTEQLQPLPADEASLEAGYLHFEEGGDALLLSVERMFGLARHSAGLEQHSDRNPSGSQAENEGNQE